MKGERILRKAVKKIKEDPDKFDMFVTANDYGCGCIAGHVESIRRGTPIKKSLFPNVYWKHLMKEVAQVVGLPNIKIFNLHDWPLEFHDDYMASLDDDEPTKKTALVAEEAVKDYIATEGWTK